MTAPITTIIGMYGAGGLHLGSYNAVYGQLPSCRELRQKRIDSVIVVDHAEEPVE